jgi:hypothetical protein
MANLTLAPEEDDFDFVLGRNSSPAKRAEPTPQKLTSEAGKLLISFNPRKVGFGILPWPGTDHSAPVSDTVAIAIQYLLEGAEHKAQGEKK